MEHKECGIKTECFPSAGRPCLPPCSLSEQTKMRVDGWETPPCSTEGWVIEWKNIKKTQGKKSKKGNEGKHKGIAPNWLAQNSIWFGFLLFVAPSSHIEMSLSRNKIHSDSNPYQMCIMCLPPPKRGSGSGEAGGALSNKMQKMLQSLKMCWNEKDVASEEQRQWNLSPRRLAVRRRGVCVISDSVF